MHKVSVEIYRGKLRIRFTYRGKRSCISLGIEDIPQNRAYAEIIKGNIERDILLNNFDDSLLRYKPGVLGNNPTEIKCPRLFEYYTKAMVEAKGLQQGSLCRYKGCLSHIKQKLNQEASKVSPRDANNFRAILLEKVSNRTAKEYLWMIQSCFEWAKGKYHVADQNPFLDISSKVKIEPIQYDKPFTGEEISVILAGFRKDIYYSHYFDFVVFLFGVGCRFGEAAGLRYKHISTDYQTVWIGESISRGVRKSTKTGKARTIILNPTISAMLKARFKKYKPTGNDLVFPAPKGGPICDRSFRRRAWKRILERYGISYRKPYNIRHSVISHALADGVHPIALAAQTGHNKRVLLDTYAHVLKQESLFKEFK
ncbi:tyrosine-type recombinase/integrase [Acaryochloris marina NIES-2412]|uniref:tyrosine-type recombinase/integrase n=1 Tax=Acaryochloris marina TaxID=155978 RepID=UPI0040592434